MPTIDFFSGIQKRLWIQFPSVNSWSALVESIRFNNLNHKYKKAFLHISRYQSKTFLIITLIKSMISAIVVPAITNSMWFSISECVIEIIQQKIKGIKYLAIINGLIRNSKAVAMV